MLPHTCIPICLETSIFPVSDRAALCWQTPSHLPRALLTPGPVLLLPWLSSQPAPSSYKEQGRSTGQIQPGSLLELVQSHPDPSGPPNPLSGDGSAPKSGFGTTH